MITNRKIILMNRPTGKPYKTNFEFTEESLQPITNKEVTVKTHYLSVDPYLRNTMRKEKFVGPPAPLGEVFGGGAVGEVVETNSDLFQKGDYVSGHWGWQTYANVEDNQITKLNAELAPISTALGVLGIAGLTAYFGMIEIGKPKAGETVVISGAAGSVGMLAGQIAKIHGARVIGIAGSNKKNCYLKNELRFDGTINYQATTNLKSSLQQVAPNGIDVYFDNVGGNISDAVMPLINSGARIPISGQISQYNLEKPELGPRIGMFLVKNNALIQGFAYMQYESHFPYALETLSKWIKDNKLKYKEHIVEGFENTPKAFEGLFSGENIGKLLVRI
ncbi:NADP-dependent oxidoreductase [Shimazuella alba]|uniref:Zinc-binding dehydrogenase n=1 Tax=Shimazuella alba TaxID=2690964 RepID=A0A6I4VQF0_9BACL|nr:NADP-dependent oxidoreductase [Shimazuella alba]MXQ53819.1 zinc-binding dehydrogenase [Shimazuella alba]